ncbi:hypothetical protein L195_g055119 [Trifolium pratense]|uniref:Uncharacterized protein n=1 Tax=Trifolium pratense TaxID=57577 RepID=A0A2K3KJM2_TRIPR|nr:hypothetical protein L195_g055119 [Trifolium pratense]
MWILKQEMKNFSSKDEMKIEGLNIANNRPSLSTPPYHAYGSYPRALEMKLEAMTLEPTPIVLCGHQSKR